MEYSPSGQISALFWVSYEANPVLKDSPATLEGTVAGQYSTLHSSM